MKQFFGDTRSYPVKLKHPYNFSLALFLKSSSSLCALLGGVLLASNCSLAATVLYFWR